jgi:hypothetical protein
MVKVYEPQKPEKMMMSTTAGPRLELRTLNDLN